MGKRAEGNHGIGVRNKTPYSTLIQIKLYLVYFVYVKKQESFERSRGRR